MFRFYFHEGYTPSQFDLRCALKNHMLIKAGVDISRLNRNIRRLLTFLEQVYHSAGDELIITSTFDGNHSAGSLHYANDAFDTRLPSAFTAQRLKEKVKTRFGTDYDVVVEGNHIHYEYDPVHL